MIDWIQCQECGAWLVPDWARCHNCGLVNEDFNDDGFDLLGGVEVSEKKKYIDLKGQVWSTPYGIGVKIFINDELLEKCKITKDQYREQKATVDAAKGEGFKPASHPTFVFDPTRRGFKMTELLRTDGKLKARFREDGSVMWLEGEADNGDEIKDLLK